MSNLSVDLPQVRDQPSKHRGAGGRVHRRGASRPAARARATPRSACPRNASRGACVCMRAAFVRALYTMVCACQMSVSVLLHVSHPNVSIHLDTYHMHTVARVLSPSVAFTFHPRRRSTTPTCLSIWTPTTCTLRRSPWPRPWRPRATACGTSTSGSVTGVTSGRGPSTSKVGGSEGVCG